jgi:glycosyltransferase involved in cell wall biosynthesis
VRDRSTVTGGRDAMNDPTISVVIPTRNREESLFRTLEALTRQTHAPLEVLVVDSGDRPLDADRLESFRSFFELIYLRSAPSVCRQRNIGIAAAGGSHVFLCDDDIEPEPRYLESIARYIADTEAEAVAGLCMEKTADGAWAYQFPPASSWSLLYSFLFQTGVWYDVGKVPSPRLAGALFRRVRSFYRRRGNTFSLAGWPLVTDFGGDTFRTSVYGLGAAVVRRDWLLRSPYSEKLSPHGIGDNYGVALGFEGACPIVVLKDVRVLHHKSQVNRVAGDQAYYQRVRAMAHFMRGSGRFTSRNRLFLLWSLLGNGLWSAGRGRLRAAALNARLICEIAMNKGLS